MAGCSAVPDFRVSGTVIDARSGLPVADARVHEGKYAPRLAAGAVIDSEGRFSYFTYPEEHGLVVEAAGYAAYRATIGLGGGEAILSILLVPTSDD